MNNSFSFNFGLDNEKRLLPIIRTFFNDDTITQSEWKRCPFDYYSATTLYELKTRTCRHNSYLDTIFPASKLDYKPEMDKVLLFSFLDGNYYIKYDKELFDTFEKETKRFRYDRGNIDSAVCYFHIPITHLIQIA